MRNIKILLAISILILGIQLVNGQGWERIYEVPFSPIASTGQSMIQTQDGGFLISITTNSQIRNTYLLKLDESGNFLWSRNYENIKGLSLIETEDGGYTILGTRFEEESSDILFKIDAEGEILWESALNQNLEFDQLILNSHVQTSDGNYFITGLADLSTGPSAYNPKFYIAKLDVFGNIIFEKYYDNTIILSGWDIIETSDNNLVISGTKASIIKINNEGEILWEVSHDNTYENILYDIDETLDGGFISTGRILESDSSFQTDALVIRADSLGNAIWTRSVEEPNHITHSFDIIEARDGDFVLAGGVSSSYNLIKFEPNNGDIRWMTPDYISSLRRDLVQTQDDGYLIAGIYQHGIYLIKTDSMGNSFTNQIQGNIWHDTQEDCIQSEEESSLRSWIVQAKKEDQIFYTTTDTLGYYNVVVDTGDYVVNVIRPSTYWTPCEDSINFSFTEFFDTTQINYPMLAVVDCPLLEVDVSTPFLRRCFDSNYHIQYCNKGTILAENVYITVAFDEYLIVNSTSIPSSNDQNNIYTFEIGDVAVGDCGTFQVNVTVDCDSTILGQTHCVEANIFPDSLCLPLDPNWDQANIEVSAECVGDSIEFIIQNTGLGGMDGQNDYIIVVDEVVSRTGNYQLDIAETEPVKEAANGETFRLQTMQTDGHPIGNTPSITVEGCGTDDPNSIHIGFVTQFPEDDDGPFVSIDCQENIGSYDPNDKQAYPKGAAEEHFIEQNTDIEYKIRFQNTGTDTAFRVVVVDTIAEFLEPTSIVPGASSHPYTFELYGYGVMKFTFDNILLVDSTTNEVGSHGFVKFRIDQKQDNPLGTIIENSASIYFDYNAPVITNTTFHTVGEDFLALISSTSEKPFENTRLSVYPNPVENIVTFHLEGVENGKRLELNLYDMTGRLIRTENYNSSTFDFSRGSLSGGMYFFSIKTKKGEVNSGKLIVK